MPDQIEIGGPRLVQRIVLRQIVLRAWRVFSMCVVLVKLAVNVQEATNRKWGQSSCGRPVISDQLPIAKLCLRSAQGTERLPSSVSKGAVGPLFVRDVWRNFACMQILHSDYRHRPSLIPTPRK